MLGLTVGFPKRKNHMISLVALTLLAGLIAGGVAFSMERDDNQVRIVQEVESFGEVAEIVEDNAIERAQPSERAVLEVLLEELEEEQLQEVIEILESGISDNQEVCPGLRVIVERVLEEQGQQEISRENTSENEEANNNNGNNNNSINEYANNNTNPPAGSPPREQGGNRSGLGERDLNNPSVLCDNSYWVANTRPVFMVGTPGFWTPRHRCILCGFTTTCIEEAFDHSKNYDFDSWPGESCICLPEVELCECVNEQPSLFPTWMFEHDPYYKYTPGDCGEIIYVPDGTYTCLSCGKIKRVGTPPSWEKKSQ